MRHPSARRVFVLVLGLVCAALSAEEVPSQFQAWGTRGPELPPTPNGWTEVRGDERAHPAPKPTDKDSAAGCIAFQRHCFEEIYFDSAPAAAERDVSLQSFAAQGQYEPFSFGIYALEDLKGCVVKVSELKSKDGVIPAVCVDVRLVRPVRSKVDYANANDKRFKWAPFYLEKWDRFDLAKNRTAQLWLTVKAPESAKPGDYQARVSVQAEGKTALEIPLLLRVMAFRLPPISIETRMSYSGAPGNAALWEKELVDMREHSIVNVDEGMGATIVSRDQVFGDDDAEATRKHIHEAVALRKKVYGADANRWPAPANIGFEILYAWDNQKGWFIYWPRSEKLEASFLKAVRTVDEALKAEGGPPMRLWIMDEPGGAPDMLKNTREYAEFAKQKFPQMPGYVTIGGGMSMGIDEIGQLGPSIDLLSTNRFTPEICQKLLERKKPYGIYNAGGATENIREFCRDRYAFGFYGWKTGASEILQWVYKFGDPWKDPIRGNHGYVYDAPDGPLPSIPFENVRAGIDDWRYMDLLWRLITAAKKSGHASEAKLGESAALAILSQIDFHYQGEGSAPPSAATLDKWRWKIASACLELLKFVSLDQALATTPVRPGPLELPFPPDDNGAGKFGPELLADGSFESGLGPWAALGKAGSGGLDKSVHHGGAQSFKIENPKTATGMDVEVCVWGWSGPGPDMTLKAGKTYEFSAWVKCDGVPPQIRCNFADAATSFDEQKEGEHANGWQRQYRRVTMAKDAKPTYLAVWLQGPGTIWCDDLSLREVVLPPFKLEPAQTLLDAADRLVGVRIRQIGGAGEISVRVTMPDQKDKPQLVKIPANGQVLVEFAGSSLPLGKHELKAELEAVNAPFATSIIFERVRGLFEP